MGLDAMALVGNISHRKFNKIKDAFDPRWLDKKEWETEDREIMTWRYRSTNASMFSIVWMKDPNNPRPRRFYVYPAAYTYLKIIAQALYGDFAYEGLKI